MQVTDLQDLPVKPAKQEQAELDDLRGDLKQNPLLLQLSQIVSLSSDLELGSYLLLTSSFNDLKADWRELMPKPFPSSCSTANAKTPAGYCLVFPWYTARP